MTTPTASSPQMHSAPCLNVALKIKIAAAFIIAFSGWVAQAKAETPLLTAPATPTRECIFKDLVSSETCPAYSSARAFEILDMGNEAIIFVEKQSKQDRTSIVASSRIEDAVLLEQMDENDGMLVEREVQELSGARYELPTSRREITRLLGFPDGAEIASSDWIEMIKVHAEMTLSLSANASRFLLEQLGVAALPDQNAAASTIQTASAAGVMGKVNQMAPASGAAVSAGQATSASEDMSSATPGAQTTPAPAAK